MAQIALDAFAVIAVIFLATLAGWFAVMIVVEVLALLFDLLSGNGR